MVAPQPRKVTALGHVKNDPLYIRNIEKIRHLRKKLEAGENINLFLSNKIRQGCFDVEDFKKTRTFNASRDRMLVCEGFYHFHLAEHPHRTDEVLIGIVDNDYVEFIGIFTHEIFESSNQSNTAMHQKYEASINAYVEHKFPQGSLIIGGVGGGMQNMAGSSISSSFNQIDKIKTIRRIELDCGGIVAFTRNLYSILHSRSPRNIKPEWIIDHRFLKIYDRANKVTFDSNSLRLHCASNPRVENG